MQTTTVTVLTARLEEARAALDKLVRKAARLGVAGVGYTVGRTWASERTVPGVFGPRRITIEWTDLEVTAEPLKVGDYSFVAKLEVTPDGTLVDKVPGATLEPKWLTWGGDCEHCKVNRSRKHLFVVQDAQGAQLAVGRSCLRAFLGTDTPSEIAAHFAFWAEVSDRDEESGFGGFRCGYHQPIEDIVTMTAVAVRLFGWCSKGQAAASGALCPTSAHVHLGLGTRPAPTGYKGQVNDSAGQLWDRLRSEFQDIDEAVAQKVIAYVRSDEFQPNTEYAHNLKVLFQRDAITDPKRLGIVVSAYAAWAKAQGFESRPAESVEVRTPNWIGEVGERLRGLLVTFDDSRVVGENQFGSVVLVTFKTENGDVLKWFTSRGVRATAGERIQLTGTVKKHDSYNGRRETLLSRCILEKAA